MTVEINDQITQDDVAQALTDVSDRLYVDELSPEEIKKMMDEIEEEAYNGHFDGHGVPIPTNVAKKRVNAANERTRNAELTKSKDERKKIEHRRASKALAKRLKKSIRRKNRK